MTKRRLLLDTILGISTEVFYALFIILAALLICFLINFKI